MEANSIGVGPPPPPPLPPPPPNRSKLRILSKTGGGGGGGTGNSCSKRRKNKKCISCQGPRSDLQEISDSQQKRCSALLEKICVLQLDILSSHLARQYDTYLEKTECQQEEQKEGNCSGANNNCNANENEEKSEDVNGRKEGEEKSGWTKSTISSAASSSSSVSSSSKNDTIMTAGASCSSAPVISAAAVNAAAAAAAAEVVKDPKTVWREGNGGSDLSVLHKIIEKIELNSSVGLTDADRYETLEKFSTFQSFDRIGKLENTKESNNNYANQNSNHESGEGVAGSRGFESQNCGNQQQQQQQRNVEVPAQLQQQLGNLQNDPSSTGEKAGKKEVNDSDLNEKLVETYNEKLAEEAQWLAVNMNRVLRETMQISKDWDETDSSCGDESCDEEIAPKYNDTDIYKLPYLPFVKNPSASWALARAAVVTSWLWNHDAIAHVSFRLEQQDQVHRHLKSTKPTFQLEDRPLPGVINPNVGSTPLPLENASYEVLIETPEVPGESQKSCKRHYPNGHRLSTPIWSEPRAVKPNALKDLILGSACPGSGETAEDCPIEKSQNPGKNHTHPLNCDRLISVGGGLEALGIKVRQESDNTYTARRCLPLKPYRPRKIFQLGGVHKMIHPSKKPAVMCECFGRKELCANCSGRIEKIKSIDGEFDDFKDLNGVLDDSYHQSLAVVEEKPVSLLVNAALQSGSWEKVPDVVPDIIGEPYVETEDTASKKVEPVRRKRRPKPDFVNARSTPAPIRGSSSKYKRRKYNSVSSEVWEDSNHSDISDEDEEYGYLFENGIPSPSGKYHSKRGSGSVQDGYRRKRDEKFDIDNIVIPYSIASTTRVEKIEYKEIITPSWRVIPNGYGKVSGKNGICSNGWDDSEIEDLSMEVIQARHDRSEVEEHKKFNLNPKKSHRRSRRLDSKADYSDPNTPDPMSPNPEANDNYLCSSTGSQSPVTQAETPFTMPPPPGTMLAPVVTEAVAALAVSALKMNSLGPGRRRTMSSTNIAITVEDDDDHVRRPSVTPWEKRTFPLSEEEYARMRAEMPEEYLRLCDEDEILCGTDQPS